MPIRNFREDDRPPRRRRQLGKRRTDSFYAGSRWRKLRASVLRRTPLCEDPERRHEGLVIPATEVHHIKPRATHPELAYTRNNLQALCKSCHSRHTLRERRDDGGHGVQQQA